MDISRETVLVLALVAATVFAAGQAGAEQQKQQVIVLFDSGENVDPGQVAQHGVVTGTADIVPAVFANVPRGKVNEIRSLDHVEAVERDAEVSASEKPPWAGGPGGGGDDGGSDQPPQSTPWGIDRVNGTEAALTVDESGVDVAVLDTGIDYDHPDLDANVEKGVDTTGNGPLKTGLKHADDKNGHGTHVAGTVAAENNSIGVIGTAPQTGLYAVQVLGNDGTGRYSDVIQGIDWAVNNGAEVVSMSLGGTSDSQALQHAVDNAYNSGAVVVAAAGNSGDGDASTNEVVYPAKYSSAVAVAATNPSDDTPVWSSEGDEVEVSAPGVDVNSTWLDGQYQRHDGTSMATPHVSGSAALLIAENSSLTPGDVREALKDSCKDIEKTGEDNFSGWGLIQVMNAVEADG